MSTYPTPTTTLDAKDTTSMNSLNPTYPVNTLADKAAATADQAINSTQRLAQRALDGLSNGVDDLKNAATPAIQRVSDQAHALAQRGLDSARDSAQHVRERAHQMSAHTVGYIKDEPLKSVLIAAATGALLMAMLGMLRRPGR